MKPDWSLSFYIMSALLSILSLVTNDLEVLSVALLLSIIAILIERKPS